MNEEVDQKIFDEIPAGIIRLDAERRIAYVNRIGRRAIGAPQDCTGRFFGEIALSALVSLVRSAREQLCPMARSSPTATVRF
ncbi:PAS domain-containing protein [Pyrinomonas sp.]|uniref:PAS domain-containing protein n=1 Tax=Pyrinomonas sp. TaxID=2080306 RepID=UPI00331B6A8E